MRTARSGDAAPARVSLRTLLTSLGILTVAVNLWSMTTGALGTPMRQVVDVLLHRVGVNRGQIDQIANVTIVDVRLPRIVLSILVGAGLAVCGAALQGVFRNPLADPGLIGVSAGAGLGAVCSIVLGLSEHGRIVTPAAAFVGAVGTSLLVYALARSNGRTNVVSLLLTGIAVNAIITSLIAYLVYLANDAQLRGITFWQLGSAAAATWSDVRLLAPFVLLGTAAVLREAGRLDVMAIGDREARSLGVDPDRTRRRLIVLCAMVTGASVALVGIVSFVGLVVPHLVRLATGPAHRRVLTGSVLGGALLVSAADLTARNIVAPQELPLGVVTALAGGGFFLYLLRRTLLRSEL